MPMTPPDLKEATHVSITGRVQGVSYRAWTVKQASALGLEGWVRNRSDRSVEALFVGEKAIIDQMIEKCHAGPLMAQVASVSVLSRKPLREMDEAVEDPAGTFRQLPTV